jgi:hypothetical protein
MGIYIVLSKDSSSDSEDSSSDQHPGIIREDASDMEDQPEWSEGEEQANISVPPRLDLAYSAEFSILSDLAAAPELLDELNPQPVDVDRWELFITPEEYLRDVPTWTVVLSFRGRHWSTGLQSWCKRQS